MIDEQFDENGLLRPSPNGEPWPVTLVEVEAYMASDARRRELWTHVKGMWKWWHDRAKKPDPNAQFWITGDFGCSLRPDVEDLNVTVVCDRAKMAAGDLWVLQRLATSSTSLHPGKLTVALADGPNVTGGAYPLDEAAARAARSVEDPTTGAMHNTGWISIVKEQI